MTDLREKLLELLRSPDYRPADEAGLIRALGLGKKQRGMVSHEVRRLVAENEAVRGRGGVLKLRLTELPKSTVPSRPIFQPRSVRLAAGAPASPFDPAAKTPKPAAGIFQPTKSRAATQPAPVPHRKGQRERQPTGDVPAAARAKPTVDGIAGRIQFRSGGSAFVVAEGEGKGDPSIQVFPEDTGTALPGDRVVVRLFPGRKGKRAGETVGRVVEIIERARETVVGELRRAGKNFLVAADDPKFPLEVLVPDPAKSGLKPVPAPGDKVIARLLEWNDRGAPLRGELTSRLGRTFEPRAELLGVYAKFNLDPRFPGDVESEVAGLPDHVRPKELANRLDYREAAVFTIDPDDAKDFDDALSIETLDGGETRVGVHIADVSAYVKPGTALDREAQRRGNSTYLVGTVIPMLPEKLSNGLCSLVEAQDRLCKAAFLTFTPAGRLKETAFGNTVIRSRKRLTYKQAYALLFENDFARIRALPLPAKHQTGSTGRALSTLTDRELADLQGWVRNLWAIAKRLRADRMAHGSLDLDMPETKVFVDAEGYADRLEKIEHDESHQLIEEFMLAANEAVARLTRTHKLPSLYRVHDDPDAERLAEFRMLLTTHLVPVGDLTERREIMKLLAILKDHPQGYTLRTQLLRSLRKACYRASPDGHYGLHKKDYTHFTSPIRRYSDLVVHRVFDTYLVKHAGYPAHSGQFVGYDLPRMQALGEHLTLTEINSAEAERESVKIKLLEFFEREVKRQPPTRFAAVITDVRPNGFFIELVDSMAFGLVPAAVLTDDRYVPADDGTALVGRRHRRKFALNGRLDVVVHAVDRFKRTIDFRPA
jgi:ribonuclease R